jgi:transcription initiation factor TFIID subunit 9B
MSVPQTYEPKDMVAIRELLASMGVEDYEPQVTFQLLDFYQRFTAEMLSHATDYKNYDDANRAVDMSDVQIAVQAQSTHSFIPSPPWQVTSALAAKLNACALPVIPMRPGVLLPPEKHCLTAANYQLKTSDELPPQQR